MFSENHYAIPESGSPSLNYGQYLDAQQALIDWVQDQQRNEIPLTRAIVRKKAAIFAAMAWSHNKAIAEGSSTAGDRYTRGVGIAGPSLSNSCKYRLDGLRDLFNLMIETV